MVNSSANKKAENIKVISLVQTVLGWIIVIFYSPVTIAGLTQLSEVADVVLLVILAGFISLGIRLIVLGKRKRKMLTKYHDYSIRLANDPDKSLIKLAGEIKESTDDVIKDINEMISSGLFPNCYIDINNNQLIMPESNLYRNSNIHNQKQTSYITVKCKNCGAPNKIAEGSVGECEFCGSQISN